MPWICLRNFKKKSLQTQIVMAVRFLKLKTNWKYSIWVSQFVTLNSSGDPVEAAEILDTAENHIVALKQIVERVPEIVTALQSKLPDQLEFGKWLPQAFGIWLPLHWNRCESFPTVACFLEEQYGQCICPWIGQCHFTKMNKFKRRNRCIVSHLYSWNWITKSCEEVSETTAWLFETRKKITIATLQQEWNALVKHSSWMKLSANS